MSGKERKMGLSNTKRMCVYLSKSLLLPPADPELIYFSVCSPVIDSLFGRFHRNPMSKLRLIHIGRSASKLSSSTCFSRLRFRLTFSMVQRLEMTTSFWNRPQDWPVYLASAMMMMHPKWCWRTPTGCTSNNKWRWRQTPFRLRVCAK